jgi:hypothetical protein
MPPGSGGSRPAAADRATGSCSGRHRRPLAVSAADTNPPDTPSWFRTQQRQPPRPRCPVPPTGRPRCPAARPTAADPQPPPAARRRRRARCACWSALVKWARSTRSAGYRLSGRVDTGRGLPDAREHARLGTADTGDRGRACGHCGSSRTGQPAAEPWTTAAMSERNGPQCAAPASMPPDPQIRSLVLSVDLVGSRPIWAGSGGMPRRSRRIRTGPIGSSG